MTISPPATPKNSPALPHVPAARGSHRRADGSGCPRAAYAADIVYTTAKELVADFLRDRLQLGPMAEAGRRTVARFLRPTTVSFPLVQRGLHTAIVDEADNQMIDEAVTPLIISRQQESAALIEASHRADQVASTLLVGEDYDISLRSRRSVSFPPETTNPPLVRTTRPRALLPARLDVHARAAGVAGATLYLRDKQYAILDGKVVIVDEFTGRLMPGRLVALGPASGG